MMRFLAFYSLLPTSQLSLKWIREKYVRSTNEDIIAFDERFFLCFGSNKALRDESCFVKQ